MEYSHTTNLFNLVSTLSAMLHEVRTVVWRFYLILFNINTSYKVLGCDEKGNDLRHSVLTN